ncbi:MAG: hypothetical protein DWH81_08730 [Planctomycetota bacterium]|nr:MAG: hypothetical protein DWH81_08730 [Planctomycetota bacterium]
MHSKIRKQVYELTLADLQSWPIWEFALDEEGDDNQDEATVRPYPLADPLDPSESTFIVAARFKLADGTQLQGCLTPPSSSDNSLGAVQPQIITERGRVSFWYGRCEPDLASTYRMLGRNSASVFPIQFESVVRLCEGAVSGTIPGFLCLEDDFETVRVVV